jgi:hypothetical protein
MRHLLVAFESWSVWAAAGNVSSARIELTASVGFDCGQKS